MNRMMNLAAGVLLCGVMMIGCAAVDAATDATPRTATPASSAIAMSSQGGPDFQLAATGRYFEEYSADPQYYIGAKSLTGEWAASATAEGETPEERWAWQMAWLEALYESKGERFIVEEGVAAAEITDMAGPAYLYEHSVLYRELVSGDTVSVATGVSFGKVADEGQNPVVERYVFHVDAASTFTLDARFALDRGEMALWIVSPDGEALYRSEPANRMDERITLRLEPGLHSVALEYHMDNQSVRGEKTIVGTLV